MPNASKDKKLDAGEEGETASEPEPTSKWRKLLSAAERSWPIVLLGVLVAVFGGYKEISEGAKEILVALHLKPDALELAQDTARSQFSDNLARTAWKRLFWTRRYLTAVELSLSETDQTEIWKGYIASVEDWNDNLMVNIMGLRHYYSEEKKSAFEIGILPMENSIHSCLLRIRYPSAYSKNGRNQCTFPGSQRSTTANIDIIGQENDALNSQLYCFVAGLDRKGKNCTVTTFDSGWSPMNSDGTDGWGPSSSPEKN